VFWGLLPDKNVSSYGKYRLLHHLSRQRRNPQDGETYSYLDRLEPLDRERTEALLPDLVGEQAFELNIIALYALRILGASHKELDAVVRHHCKRPIPVPIKNVLMMVAKSAAPVEATALADVPESEGQEYY
jgi:hypothetical protein